jgi:hypothetical protein
MDKVNVENSNYESSPVAQLLYGALPTASVARHQLIGYTENSSRNKEYVARFDRVSHFRVLQ